MIYGRTGDSYVVVASKGGAPAPPAWYLNVMAEPDCEIQVARDVIPVRARNTEGVERETLWKQMVEVLPQYEEYQARTERKIPVVVLDPRGVDSST